MVSVTVNIARQSTAQTLVPLFLSVIILTGCAGTHPKSDAAKPLKTQADLAVDCSVKAGAWFKSAFHQAPGAVAVKNKFGGTDVYTLTPHYSQTSSKCYARVGFNSPAGHFGMFRSIEYEEVGDGEPSKSIGEYTALLGSDMPSRCVWRGQPCEAAIDELAAKEDVGEPDLPTEKHERMPYYGDPGYQKEVLPADIFFEFGSSTLDDPAHVALNFLLRRLQGMKLEVIVVTGYTDAIGSEAYKRVLSARRAEAVKAYLVSKGIETGRIYTEGKGKEKPNAPNSIGHRDNPGGRAQNRRVEVEAVAHRE